MRQPEKISPMHSKKGSLKPAQNRKLYENPGLAVMGGYSKIYRVEKFDAKACAKLRGKAIVLDNQGLCYWMKDGKQDAHLPSSHHHLSEIPLANSNEPVEYTEKSKEAINKIILSHMAVGHAPLPQGEISIIEKKAVKHSEDKRDLFSSPPVLADVKQGAIGNCYFMATLMALINMPGGPAWIMEHMIDNGDGTVTVKLYDQSGKPHEITVEKSLRDDHGSFLIWGSRFPQRSQGALWVGILEKAFTAFSCHGNYILLGNGGEPIRVLEILTGKRAEKNLENIDLENFSKPDEQNIFHHFLELKSLHDTLAAYQKKEQRIIKLEEEVKNEGREFKSIIILRAEKPPSEKDLKEGAIYITLNKKGSIDYLCGGDHNHYPLKYLSDETNDLLMKYIGNKEQISCDDAEFNLIISLLPLAKPSKLLEIARASEIEDKEKIKEIKKELLLSENLLDQKELEIWNDMLSSLKDYSPRTEYEDLMASYQKGSNIYLMSSLSKSFLEYKNSYIFILGEKGTLLLYFVNNRGKIINLEMSDAEEKNLRGIKMNEILKKSDPTKDKELSPKVLNQLWSAIHSVKNHTACHPHETVRMHEAIALFKKVMTQSGKKQLNKAQEIVLNKVIARIEQQKIYPGKRGTGQYTFKQMELYSKINEALRAGKVVMLGSNSVVSRKGGERQEGTGEIKWKGLAGDHVYTLLGCEALHVDKNPLGLLGYRIRNPWGNYGRVYFYAQNGHFSAKEDKSGEFWLELNDLHKRFSVISIAELPAVVAAPKNSPDQAKPDKSQDEAEAFSVSAGPQ